jgi:hypothetical protein
MPCGPSPITVSNPIAAQESSPAIAPDHWRRQRHRAGGGDCVRGADVLIAYLDEHDDAKDTQRLVEEAGRKAVLLAGDILSAAHCRKIIETACEKLGGIFS